MSRRKFNISHLTQIELDAIADKYPNAVKTIRKPVYKIIAMLLECGLDVPGVQRLDAVKQMGMDRKDKP